jgi:hypothetical protein
MILPCGNKPADITWVYLIELRIMTAEIIREVNGPVLTCTSCSSAVIAASRKYGNNQYEVEE